MKNRASVFLKQIISVLSTVVKAKSLAVKEKTSAMKTRLMIFSLLKNKKMLLASISHKLHALVGQQDNDQSKATVVYNAMANESHSNPSCTEFMKMEEEDDNKYPDLTHSLFDSDELDFADHHGSVVDLVRNSKDDGENFCLEDEIDHVADLFIRKFHRQMRMQKLESFKIYQDMLDRSV